MNFKLFFTSLFAALIIGNSCDSHHDNHNGSNASDSSVSKPAIKEEAVTYSLNGVNFKSYVAYDSNKQGTRPAVLVVHEWWGLNDYARSRAKQLADLGYVAMAVDMYGDNKSAEDPKGAEALATPFYTDPSLTKTRLEAGMSQLRKLPQVDTSKIAAMGYCFGGYTVLNAAKLGSDLKGVVSFHGNLGGAPVNKDLIKAKILICHGAADEFVNPEVPGFKHVMDSAKVDYTFKEYPDATHAFTNPAATEKGKQFNMPIRYNAAADSASWNDMKAFFRKIF